MIGFVAFSASAQSKKKQGNAERNAKSETKEMQAPAEKDVKSRAPETKAKEYQNPPTQEYPPKQAVPQTETKKKPKSSNELDPNAAAKKGRSKGGSEKATKGKK